MYSAASAPTSNVALGSAYPVSTGQRVNFSCAGIIRGVWWYRTAADTGIVTASVWRNGQLVGRNSGAPSTTGWAYLALPTPIAVSAGEQLILGVHHPNGAYGTTVNGFTGRSLTSTSGCMNAPASTAAQPNGLYDYASTAVLPKLSYAASEYWIGADFVRSS